MANGFGLLADDEGVNPLTGEPVGVGGEPQQIQQQLGARNAGYAAVPSRPGQQPSYMNPQMLAQLYSTMASGADNPAQIGQQYVGAMQQQQALDRQNSPVEQYLRIYGSINPFDYDPNSIADFHDHFVKTGEMNHRLLRERERLSSQEEKWMNEAMQEAQGAEQTMGRMSYLASEFERLGPDMHSGVAGRFTDWVTGLLGKEGQVQALRTEYEQFKNELVVENLPPGVASDTDIAIAMRGWPPSTADPWYIASFMRGMQKLQALKHAQATHKAYYIGRHKNQTGLLEDWNMNRNQLQMEALNRYGGINTPMDDQGNYLELTPQQIDERARQQYLRRHGNTRLRGDAPGQGGRTGQVTPAPAADDLSDEDLVDRWK